MNRAMADRLWSLVREWRETRPNSATELGLLLQELGAPERCWCGDEAVAFGACELHAREAAA